MRIKLATDSPQTFGDFLLKELLRDDVSPRYWTIPDFAAAVGVTSRTVDNWLDDRCLPRDLGPVLDALYASRTDLPSSGRMLMAAFSKNDDGMRHDRSA